MFSVIVCSGLSSKLECFRRLMPSRAGRGSNAYACSCIFSFYSSQSLPHVAFNCVMLPNSAELSWFFWLFSFIAFKYLRVLTNSFFPNLSFPFLQWNIYVLLLLSLCILLFGLICWLPFHFLFSKFLLKNIYFWMLWVFILVQAFSSCFKQELHLVMVLRLLISVASLIAECRLEVCSLQELQLVRSKTQAQ